MKSEIIHKCVLIISEPCRQTRIPMISRRPMSTSSINVFILWHMSTAHEQRFPIFELLLNAFIMFGKEKPFPYRIKLLNICPSTKQDRKKPTACLVPCARHQRRFFQRKNFFIVKTKDVTVGIRLYSNSKI